MRVVFPLEPKAFRRFPKSAQRLGVMMLSSMLRQEGFNVELAKATVDDLSETLRHGEPTILAYSMVSQLAEPMLEVNREIKKIKMDLPTGYLEMKDDGMGNSYVYVLKPGKLDEQLYDWEPIKAYRQSELD